MPLLLILFGFGLASGVIAKRKGSSFAIWFLVGFCIPFFGLIAAVLYRVEHDEPESTCPRCGRRLKMYTQVCSRCGEDLYLHTEDAKSE